MKRYCRAGAPTMLQFFGLLLFTACGSSSPTSESSPKTENSTETEADATGTHQTTSTPNAGDAQSSTDGASEGVIPPEDGGISDATLALCTSSACVGTGSCGYVPTYCAGQPVEIDCGLCDWEVAGPPFGNRGPEWKGYCGDVTPNRCGSQCSQIYESSDPVCQNGDRSFGPCMGGSKLVYAWDKTTRKKVYRAGNLAGCTFKIDRWCCPLP